MWPGGIVTSLESLVIRESSPNGLGVRNEWCGLNLGRRPAKEKISGLNSG